MIISRIVPFVFGLVILCGWLVLSSVLHKTTARKILVSLFILYLTAVAAVTIFPIMIDPETYIITDKSIRLVPFSTIIDFIKYATVDTIVLQIIGNILMTIPYGVFILFFTKRKRWYNCLAHAIGFPVLIELSQLAMCLLTNSFYRTVDIDDVILNALGIAIGYGIYRLLPKAIKDYIGDTGQKAHKLDDAKNAK